MYNKIEKNIKVLVMDVDGTLTDGLLYISSQGEEFKSFSIKDGYGINELLPAAGIIPAIITGRKSEIVNRRCEEIGIEHVFQGVHDKDRVLRELASTLSLSLRDNFAYIGDDDNDLTAMGVVALVGCPADASKNVLKAADFVSSKNGGHGAVRDFIEWILD